MNAVIARAALLLLAGTLLVSAQTPDQQYIGIYAAIQQADNLLETGQPREALARYLEAQAALKRLQAANPDWNPRVVKFRLSYIAAKVATATARAGGAPPATPAAPPTPALPTPATAPTQPAEPSPELLRELQSLREQVSQLQADKNLLEAKLREALAVQPAATDPRELARAQDRIRELEKETELLKVSLANEQTRQSASEELKPAVERLRRELADAQRQLREQTARAKALSDEKAALQKQLETRSGNDARQLARAREQVASLEREVKVLREALQKQQSTPQTAATDTAALDQLRAELAAANRRATEQADLAASLAREKAEIEKRLAALAQDTGIAGELAQTKQALAEANRRLAEQTEANQQLARVKQELETRVQRLSADAEALEALRAENALLKQQVAAAKQPAGRSAGRRDLQAARARIAALQSDLELLRLEKTALEQRLQAASRATGSPATAPPPAAAEESQTLAALRARLAVLEAQPVPYSAEELALMRQPPPRLAQTPSAGTPAAPATAAPSLGPGALIAEAQRQFAARNLAAAETNYLQALRQDNRDGLTRANLAVVLMEQNKLDEAEQHAREAVRLAPQDAYGHLVLGQIKLRQNAPAEAVDALSRAAQLNPRSAEVQNFLGIALSHQGHRQAAETALRKAIQLEPGYASAHHNLAVIYLNQQPPMVALARWHYQKALAAGQPRNPDLEKALEAKQPSAGAPE